MIPKIIHYCWLGKKPLPENLEIYINSWKKYLPEYEIILWDLEKFDIEKSLWVKQACDSKMYAFATDYMRLYALYNYGGIYLDTDVEVLKTFNDLLHLPYFIGKENTKYGIESAILGVEKGCVWIKKCLDYYDHRNFIKESGVYDIEPLPSIMNKVIRANFNLISIPSIDKIDNNKENVYILPLEYFSPKKWDDPSVLNLTCNTYTIHHFYGSWKKDKSKLNISNKNLLRNKIKKLIKKIFYVKN